MSTDGVERRRHVELTDAIPAAIERLMGRRVTAFLSANQTDPGVASELFFLEAPPT